MATTASAASIDAHLRRLARREAHARLELGRLAALFLTQQGHTRLGFARAGDYARERLGISTSRFYEASRVAISLASLPSIESALIGGAISWTKARELAGVASPDTEAAWLSLAARCTADRLHELVRLGRRDADAPAAPSYDYENEENDDDIDGEPAVTVAIRCPRAVRLAWLDTWRLVSQVAGHEVTAWQAAEAVAAEALSGSGWPDEESGSLRRPMPSAAGAPDTSGTAGETIPETCSPRERARRDHRARMRARSSAMSADQLDRRMRSSIAAMQRNDADMGMLLCRVADRRLHHLLGYGDLGDYCRNALGICARKAYALIAVERLRRRNGSRLTQAYRAGLLSWHRCLVLLPVLTASTVEAWIERAQLVTARRLADEVMWARMAYDAGAITEPAPPELGARLDADLRAFVQIGGNKCREHRLGQGIGDALLDAEVRFRAPGTVADLFRAAVYSRCRAGEPAWAGLLRLLEEVRAYWLAAPRHRDPVFARDGWRCAVPACSSRRNLHDHHVRFRSQGGGGERDNRVTVCAAHHLHGLHRGLVRASGKAGAGLDWELGRTSAGEPLLRISGRGEVYVHRGAA